jgi:hypothetical protein
LGPKWPFSKVAIRLAEFESLSQSECIETLERKISNTRRGEFTVDEETASLGKCQANN